MGPSLSLFLQSRFNLTVYRLVGWRWAYRYLMSLTWLYLLVHWDQQRRIGQAVAGALGLQGWWHRQMVMQKVFRGIGSHYFEKLFNVCATARLSIRFFQTHVRDEGLAVIRQALTRGRGVLLVTGHLGGVEFLPGYLGYHQLPVSIVVRFATQRLRAVSLAKAAAFGIGIIDAEQTPNVMRAVLAELARNRVVITQCDEIDEWRPGTEEQIDFLGKQVYMDRTLTVLIKRSRTEAAFGVMQRCGKGYRFIALPAERVAALCPGPGSPSIGTALLRLLERYVRAYPQEWYLWKKMDQLGTITCAPAPVPTPAAAGPGRHSTAVVQG